MHACSSYGCNLPAKTFWLNPLDSASGKPHYLAFCQLHQRLSKYLEGKYHEISEEEFKEKNKTQMERNT